MTIEEIERIVRLIKETTDEDIKGILKQYLSWNLMPPMITVGKEPGSIEYR